MTTKKDNEKEEETKEIKETKETKETKKPNGVKAKDTNASNSKKVANGAKSNDKKENGAPEEECKPAEEKPIDVKHTNGGRISSNSIKAVLLALVLLASFYALLKFAGGRPEQIAEVVVSPPTYNVAYKEINGVKVSANNCWFINEQHRKAIEGLTKWAAPLGIQTILLGGTISNDQVILDTDPDQKIPISYFKEKAETSKTLCLFDNPGYLNIPEMYFTSFGDVSVYEGRTKYAGFIPSITKTTILKSGNVYGHLTEDIMDMKIGVDQITVSKSDDPLVITPAVPKDESSGIWEKTKELSANTWDKTKEFFKPKPFTPEEEVRESLENLAKARKDVDELHEKYINRMNDKQKELEEELQRTRANKIN